ncbi:MAG: acyltransferase family protein [Bacteroidota bacterium]
MSKRINYIDVARGIGILLVVMGHNDFSLISPFFHKLIYSFHMPLFFFLSGYFLNTAIGFWSFVKKRFNGLLKPFFFTIFMIYFFSISFEKMGFANAITRIVKSLYGTGAYIDWVQLWFLPHLFVVSIYAYLFYKTVGRIDNRWIRWLILLITLFVASLFLKSFYPFTIALLGKSFSLLGLPFSLDLVLLSGFFFILGSETRSLDMEKLYGNVPFLLITGTALVLMNIFLSPTIDLNTRVYDSFIVSTLEAIAGILFIMALSRQVDLHTSKLSNMFQYIGRITLIILILHGPIQDFWGQKILALTQNQVLSYWLAFAMGVLGPIMLFELFVRSNPIASFWLGREAEPPRQKHPRAEAAPLDLPEGQKVSDKPVVQ